MNQLKNYKNYTVKITDDQGNQVCGHYVFSILPENSPGIIEKIVLNTCKSLAQHFIFKLGMGQVDGEFRPALLNDQLRPLVEKHLLKLKKGK